MTVTEPNLSSNYGTSYRRRVESFIRENKHQLTISKLLTNVPITSKELTLLEEILFDQQNINLEKVHNSRRSKVFTELSLYGRYSYDVNI